MVMLLLPFFVFQISFPVNPFFSTKRVILAEKASLKKSFILFWFE